MKIAQPTSFEPTKLEAKNHDATIMLGYAAFAIVLLIAVYVGSMSAGTAPSDLTTMTALP